MIQVRVYDETNKRISYQDFRLQTEYTNNPACKPPLHYFPIGSGVCTCRKYDGTPETDPTPSKVIVSAKDKK